MRRKISLNLKLGKKTLVMGILNITPDSFSDGNKYFKVDDALKRAEEIINEGADILDIGGESTRPGSMRITAEEELKRIMPAVTKIRKKFPQVVISVDTYKSEVAEEALRAGVDLINSMGGFMFDPHLSQAIKKYECPIIIFHTRGDPKTMQKGEIHYDNLVENIIEFLNKQVSFGLETGITREKMLIDPGFGFGKSVSQNIEIIKRLKDFSNLSLPIVVGISRKSHLGAILQEELHLKDTPGREERLEASLAETAIAVLNGAKIVRTHDVAVTKHFLAVLDKFK